MNTARVGQQAEDAAVAYLRNTGYVIIARNVRTPEGEIDIVAREGDTVVFLEVKARRSHRFGSAVAAVDTKKRRRIRESAANFMQFYPQVQLMNIRFDVLAIDSGTYTLLRAAF